MEALILLDIDIPSLRVLGNDKEHDSENLRANLNLIEEV